MIGADQGVTAEDREAARGAYYSCYENEPNDLWMQALVDGKHDDDPQVIIMRDHRLSSTAALEAEIASLKQRLESAEGVLRPFTDLGPQRGAWGVISKKLDGLAPLTVTVTKSQMLAALSFLQEQEKQNG